MISEAAEDKAVAAIDRARSAGARVLAGAIGSTGRGTAGSDRGRARRRRRRACPGRGVRPGVCAARGGVGRRGGHGCKRCQAGPCDVDLHPRSRSGAGCRSALHRHPRVRQSADLRRITRPPPPVATDVYTRGARSRSARDTLVTRSISVPSSRTPQPGGRRRRLHLRRQRNAGAARPPPVRAIPELLGAPRRAAASRGRRSNERRSASSPTRPAWPTSTSNSWRPFQTSIGIRAGGWSPVAIWRSSTRRRVTAGTRLGVARGRMAAAGGAAREDRSGREHARVRPRPDPRRRPAGGSRPSSNTRTSAGACCRSGSR